MSKSRLCIGIDLGTSKSGFSLMYNNARPACCYQYPQEVPPYPKTRTALLYRKAADGSAVRPPMAWGAEAYFTYISLKPSEQSSYLYVETFKLGLAPGGEGRRAFDGAPMLSAGLELSDVISDYLEKLVGHLKDHVVRALPIDPDFSTATWAITVPAKWGDEAKQVMRMAALKAGIIDKADSKNLVLVHEPEAAALACQKRGDLDLREGDTFLVIDAGGGTIDITWHKVVGHAGNNGDRGLRLSDATHRGGLTFGGCVMDTEFLQHVKNILGAAYDEWMADPAAANELVRLLGNWQNVKHQFDGGEPKIVYNGVAYCSVRMPELLVAKLPSQQLQEFESILNELNDVPVPEDIVRDLFNTVETQVLGVVQKMKERAGKATAGSCTKVLLVGGMSSNHYLQQRLTAGLARILPRATVIAPDYGYAATVEGAALFANDPTVITSRRSPLTYGIRVARPAEADSPSRTGSNCLDFFQPFVKKNDEVPVNFRHTQMFAPYHEDQKVVKFDLYATATEPPPKYCSQIAGDPGKLATVRLKVPERGWIKSIMMTIQGRREYRLKASITFGAAEIKFGALDVEENKAVATTVEFRGLNK